MPVAWSPSGTTLLSRTLSQVGTHSEMTISTFCFVLPYEIFFHSLLTQLVQHLYAILISSKPGAWHCWDRALE